MARLLIYLLLMAKGILYLIPVPISPDGRHSLSGDAIRISAGLDYYIAERAKTARRWLRYLHADIDFTKIEVEEIGKGEVDPDFLLQPLINGRDAGLVSEAGCPGVADPGALIVARAHQLLIKVVPLVGPSSILLALMASGFSGQNFQFHGYLPINSGELKQRLRYLDQQVRRDGGTHIFMDTPYRSVKTYEMILKTLPDDSHLALASDLTGESEFVASRSIAHWKRGELPPIDGKPVIFLLGQSGG